MSTVVNARAVIDIPREQAWNKLRDLSLAANYVPGLVKVEITTEQKEGVGASRKVFQSESRYIEETVEEWNEGEGFLIRLHKGNKPAPPFKQAWFRYHLADHGNGNTLFTASMIYELPWGAFGRLLDTLLISRITRKVIGDVAISMKLYYESGEKTTPAKLKQFKAAPT